jgi:hypothetical protein
LTTSTASTTPRYSAADEYDVDLILRLRAT